MVLLCVGTWFSRARWRNFGFPRGFRVPPWKATWMVRLWWLASGHKSPDCPPAVAQAVPFQAEGRSGCWTMTAKPNGSRPRGKAAHGSWWIWKGTVLSLQFPGPGGPNLWPMSGPWRAGGMVKRPGPTEVATRTSAPQGSSMQLFRWRDGRHPADGYDWAWPKGIWILGILEFFLACDLSWFWEGMMLRQPAPGQHGNFSRGMLPLPASGWPWSIHVATATWIRSAPNLLQRIKSGAGSVASYDSQRNQWEGLTSLPLWVSLKMGHSPKCAAAFRSTYSLRAAGRLGRCCIITAGMTCATPAAVMRNVSHTPWRKGASLKDLKPSMGTWLVGVAMLWTPSCLMMVGTMPTASGTLTRNIFPLALDPWWLQASTGAPGWAFGCRPLGAMVQLVGVGFTSVPPMALSGAPEEASPWPEGSTSRASARRLGVEMICLWLHCLSPSVYWAHQKTCYIYIHHIIHLLLYTCMYIYILYYIKINIYLNEWYYIYIYYIVIYYNKYYIILYYIILYYIMLHYIMIYYFIFYHIISYHILLYCYIKIYSIILFYYNILYYIIFYYLTLYYIFYHLT